MPSFTYFGGLCPFIFHVPTKIVISLFGQTLSSSCCPKREYGPTLPCKKFLCLALLVGIRLEICDFLVKLSALDERGLVKLSSFSSAILFSEALARPLENCKKTFHFYIQLMMNS